MQNSTIASDKNDAIKQKRGEELSKGGKGKQVKVPLKHVNVQEVKKAELERAKKEAEISRQKEEAETRRKQEMERERAILEERRTRAGGKKGDPGDGNDMRSRSSDDDASLNELYPEEPMDFTPASFKRMYSDCSRVQYSMEVLEKAKRRKAMEEQKKGRDRRGYSEEAVGVLVDLDAYLSRNDSKVSKTLVIENEVLVAENESLKLRLEDKTRSEERLWKLVNKGGDMLGEEKLPERDRESPGGNGIAQDVRRIRSRDEAMLERNGSKEKPTYAVIVKGNGMTDAKVLKHKMLEAGQSVQVKVNRMREMRGGKIIMEMATEEDRQALLRERSLKEKGIVVERERKYPPLVEVKGVRREVLKDEWLTELWQKNLQEDVDAQEFEAKVRIKMVLGSRNNRRGNVILETTPLIREALLAKERVYVGWEAHGVGDFDKPMRCLKCYGFAHMMKECKKEARCGRCGGEGHLQKTCKEEVGCAVCKERGLEGGHSVWSEACPEMQRRRKRWRERIQE
ncbi:hypothetical protein TKK_0002090 [Trichogramma kaykai]